MKSLKNCSNGEPGGNSGISGRPPGPPLARASIREEEETFTTAGSSRAARSAKLAGPACIGPGDGTADAGGVVVGATGAVEATGAPPGAAQAPAGAATASASRRAVEGRRLKCEESMVDIPTKRPTMRPSIWSGPPQRATDAAPDRVIPQAIPNEVPAYGAAGTGGEAR